ncbi:unnamed protein product [Rangifer tarandus platyrhynchus]|uniref:Uncharacterized protein n=1 Tax=Rangifer tarandus platyrhynchus TaxID=3082113 RepID=A0ABN8XK46_RANTA|nr:unnamed protein product [Rangifer tarandus platyrhynchus]
MMLLASSVCLTSMLAATADDSNPEEQRSVDSSSAEENLQRRSRAKSGASAGHNKPEVQPAGAEGKKKGKADAKQRERQEEDDKGTRKNKNEEQHGEEDGSSPRPRCAQTSETPSMAPLASLLALVYVPAFATLCGRLAAGLCTKEYEDAVDVGDFRRRKGTSYMYVFGLYAKRWADRLCHTEEWRVPSGRSTRLLVEHLLRLWSSVPYVPMLVCPSSLFPYNPTLPWPKRENLKKGDLLRDVLDTGILTVAGVGGASLSSGQVQLTVAKDRGDEGNYNRAEPTGFFPDYLRAIADTIEKQYNAPIRVRWLFYPSVESAQAGVLRGEAHMTDIYFLLAHSTPGEPQPLAHFYSTCPVVGSPVLLIVRESPSFAGSEIRDLVSLNRSISRAKTAETTQLLAAEKELSETAADRQIVFVSSELATTVRHCLSPLALTGFAEDSSQAAQLVLDGNALAVITTGVLPRLHPLLRVVSAHILLGKGAWIERTYSVECVEEEHGLDLSAYARERQPEEMKRVYGGSADASGSNASAQVNFGVVLSESVYVCRVSSCFRLRNACCQVPLADTAPLRADPARKPVKRVHTETGYILRARALPPTTQVRVQLQLAEVFLLRGDINAFIHTRGPRRKACLSTLASPARASRPEGTRVYVEDICAGNCTHLSPQRSVKGPPPKIYGNFPPTRRGQHVVKPGSCSSHFLHAATAIEIPGGMQRHTVSSRFLRQQKGPSKGKYTLRQARPIPPGVRAVRLSRDSAYTEASPRVHTPSRLVGPSQLLLAPPELLRRLLLLHFGRRNRARQSAEGTLVLSETRHMRRAPPNGNNSRS